MFLDVETHIMNSGVDEHLCPNHIDRLWRSTRTTTSYPQGTIVRGTYFYHDVILAIVNIHHDVLTTTR